jgi:hypothetical protein
MVQMPLQPSLSIRIMFHFRIMGIMGLLLVLISYIVAQAVAITSETDDSNLADVVADVLDNAQSAFAGFSESLSSIAVDLPKPESVTSTPTPDLATNTQASSPSTYDDFLDLVSNLSPSEGDRSRPMGKLMSIVPLLGVFVA